MRLVFISDTHNQHNKLHIPNGDILIHSGDATGNGSIQEFTEFNEWLGTLSHPTKIFIPGNHDRLAELDETLARKILFNAEVLIDQEFIYKGIKFYGSPWQPEFFNWAYNLPRGEKLAEKWALIPNDTNVLITHGPPHGILDNIKGRAEHLGCVDLKDRVLQVKPMIHAFGHIHSGANGAVKLQHGTLYINASQLDEHYKPKYKPVVVEI